MTQDQWEMLAKKMLVGRTIKSVAFMSHKDAEQCGWDKRPLIIELDNGLCLYPSADDEGNEGGALFHNNEDHPIFPVLR